MQVSAGVVTAAEVNGPTTSGLTLKDYADTKAPSLWSLIWFLLAVAILFII